ncbi:MAG: hypothetical protein ACI84D_001606 [Thalassolituus oleivorans]|jgi:hypothetical protein
MTARALPLFVILLGVTTFAHARQTAETGVPTARASSLQGDITIDGRLNDAGWEGVEIATGFVQQLPVEGDPATIKTEARVVFDGQAVYVSARMYDPDPSSIAKQMVRRDESGQFDDFVVGFDTNLDLRTGYLFRVSAANVQWDAYMFDDGELDTSWNAVWTSAIHIDEEGWSVEMRIPLSQMRYVASDAPQTWGVDYVRHKKSTNEETQFALISQLQKGRVSQFGRLENVLIQRAARRIEVRPYVLSRAATGPAEEGNPFQDGSDFGSQVGFDFRYGLGAQFNLDATFNPDFGQVEADPAVINLTGFETFFPEQRPFFVEDARIFDFRLSGRSYLFYSRRIGREPSGRAPDGAEFFEKPEAASIQAAAKLTGRTSKGLSVGVLTALTQRETGNALFTSDPTGLETNYPATTSAFTVEPRTGFGVVRLRQDFNGGASTVGFIGTAAKRDLPEDGAFDFLTSTALNAGIDWEHQWADREWSFNGYAAGSRVSGDEEALVRIQRSSNHYFQRPDATRLDLDSTRTDLSGLDWRMTLERQRGKHWTGSVWAAQVTPGFEINDLGFSNTLERLDGGMRVTYKEIDPGQVLRNYSVSFFSFHNWMHEALDGPLFGKSWSDAHVSGSATLRSEVEFLNYWRIESSISLKPELTSRTQARGGPLLRMPGSQSYEVTVESDARKLFSIEPSIDYEVAGQDSGDQLKLSIGAKYRPSPRVEIGLEPEWTRSNTGAQYVTSLADESFESTFGRRYIFGVLERQEFGLEARVSVTLNPRLSLQIFAQPLLSAGNYVDYRQLIKPMSYSFDTFEAGAATAAGCSGAGTCVDADGTRFFDFDRDGTADGSTSDRNFNVRSLIGNAVLRWEYRPGSTLFLVWQRQQSDRVAVGDFDFRRDAEALLNADAYNVLILKLNYWFGV